MSCERETPTTAPEENPMTSAPAPSFTAAEDVQYAETVAQISRHYDRRRELTADEMITDMRGRGNALTDLDEGAYADILSDVADLLETAENARTAARRRRVADEALLRIQIDPAV
jgi:hypothetical protein